MLQIKTKEVECFYELTYQPKKDDIIFYIKRRFRFSKSADHLFQKTEHANHTINNGSYMRSERFVSDCIRLFLIYLLCQWNLLLSRSLLKHHRLETSSLKIILTLQ